MSVIPRSLRSRGRAARRPFRTLFGVVSVTAGCNLAVGLDGLSDGVEGAGGASAGGSSGGGKFGGAGAGARAGTGGVGKAGGDAGGTSNHGGEGGAGGRGGAGGIGGTGNVGGGGGTGAEGGTDSGGAGRGGAGGDVPTSCGDGVLAPDEECDDGNANAGDRCVDCVVVCDAGEFEDAKTHHCYRAVNVRANWAEARGACVVSGGGLAALSSQAELTSVSQKLNTNVVPPLGYWTGGNDLTKRGVYTWGSGEPPWDKTLFFAGEPNGGLDGAPDEDCIAITYDIDKAPFGWALYDFRCDGKLPYICERKPDGTAR